MIRLADILCTVSNIISKYTKSNDRSLRAEPGKLVKGMGFQVISSRLVLL